MKLKKKTIDFLLKIKEKCKICNGIGKFLQQRNNPEGKIPLLKDLRKLILQDCYRYTNCKNIDYIYYKLKKTFKIDGYQTLKEDGKYEIKI